MNKIDIIVKGRSGSGKTTIALELGRILKNAGFSNVGVFEEEMRAEEVAITNWDDWDKNDTTILIMSEQENRSAK